MPPANCVGLPSPLKRPQLSSGTQAFSHSTGQERAGTEGGDTGGTDTTGAGITGAEIAGAGSSVFGNGNGAGVAMANGSGTLTVVSTGRGALRGGGAVWQPTTNSASRQ